MTVTDDTAIGLLTEPAQPLPCAFKHWAQDRYVDCTIPAEWALVLVNGLSVIACTPDKDATVAEGGCHGTPGYSFYELRAVNPL